MANHFHSLIFPTYKWKEKGGAERKIKSNCLLGQEFDICCLFQSPATIKPILPVRNLRFCKVKSLAVAHK